MTSAGEDGSLLIACGSGCTYWPGRRASITGRSAGRHLPFSQLSPWSQPRVTSSEPEGRGNCSQMIPSPNTPCAGGAPVTAATDRCSAGGSMTDIIRACSVDPEEVTLPAPTGTRGRSTPSFALSIQAPRTPSSPLAPNLTSASTGDESASPAIRPAGSLKKPVTKTSFRERSTCREVPSSGMRSRRSGASAASLPSSPSIWDKRAFPLLSSSNAVRPSKSTEAKVARRTAAPRHRNRDSSRREPPSCRMGALRGMVSSSWEFIDPTPSALPRFPFYKKRCSGYFLPNSALDMAHPADGVNKPPFLRLNHRSQQPYTTCHICEACVPRHSFQHGLVVNECSVPDRVWKRSGPGRPAPDETAPIKLPLHQFQTSLHAHLRQQNQLLFFRSQASYAPGLGHVSCAGQPQVPHQPRTRHPTLSQVNDVVRRRRLIFQQPSPHREDCSRQGYG